MKNDSIDNILLDINRERVKASISVRYGDTKTRSLHCTLVNNGSLVKLQNAIFAELLIKKADGYETDNDMVIYENELQYTWRTQDVNALGENVCQIMVTFDDGGVITSPEFSMYVHKKVLDQRVQESMNEYTAITQQLVDTKMYAGEASKSATSAAQSEQAAGEIYENMILESEQYVQNVTEIMNEARQSADEAEESASQAYQSKESAANTYAEVVKVSNEYLENIAEIRQAVDDSKSAAGTYAETAGEYKNAAEASATEAGEHERAAESFVNSAGEKAEMAALAADSAKQSENNSLEYKNLAEGYAENAAVSEQKADEYQKQAKEYLDKFAEGNLTLGETSTTAFRGDYGKVAYEHSLQRGNPHNTSYTDVGAEKAGAADAALVSAKEYADTKSSTVYQNAAEYTDGKMTNAYQNATAYTDQKIADLINGAPETLDTLKEIADAMAENEEVVQALDEAIGKKANAVEVKSHEDNTTIHITASERTKWNEITEVKKRLELLEDMIGYPINKQTNSEE